MRRVVTMGGTIALIAACAGGIRPGYAPLYEAVADTVAAVPAVAVEALVTGLAAEGLRVQWQSATEGYVESQWYDVVSRQSGSFDRTRPEQFIRIRFFVDPVGTTASVLHGEAVSLRSVDPSRIERDTEMMLPPGNAGREILTRVMRQVARSLGG